MAPTPDFSGGPSADVAELITAIREKDRLRRELEEAARAQNEFVLTRLASFGQGWDRQLEGLRSENADLKGRLKGAEQSAADGRAKVREQEVQIRGLETRLIGKESLIMNLQREKAQHEKEKDGLRIQRFDLQAENSTLKIDLAKCVLEKSDIQAESSTLKGDLAKCASEKREIEAENSTLKTDLAKYAKGVEDLRAALQTGAQTGNDEVLGGDDEPEMLLHGVLNPSQVKRICAGGRISVVDLTAETTPSPPDSPLTSGASLQTSFGEQAQGHQQPPPTSAQALQVNYGTRTPDHHLPGYGSPASGQGNQARAPRRRPASPAPQQASYPGPNPMGPMQPSKHLGDTQTAHIAPKRRTLDSTASSATETTRTSFPSTTDFVVHLTPLNHEENYYWSLPEATRTAMGKELSKYTRKTMIPGTGPDFWSKLMSIAPDDDAAELLKSKCLRTLFTENGKKSMWTKAYPREYACIDCTSTLRPCMLYDVESKKIHILPLHDVAKSVGSQTSPSNPEYWIRDEKSFEHKETKIRAEVWETDPSKKRKFEEFWL